MALTEIFAGDLGKRPDFADALTSMFANPDGLPLDRDFSLRIAPDKQLVI